MTDYKVTFNCNVKVGEDLYKAGEEATVPEDAFETVHASKLIEPKFEEIERAPKSIEEMTVAELKKYAKDNNIDLGEAKKKEEILEVIQAAENEDEGENDQTPAEE